MPELLLSPSAFSDGQEAPSVHDSIEAGRTLIERPRRPRIRGHEGCGSRSPEELPEMPFRSPSQHPSDDHDKHLVSELTLPGVCPNERNPSRTCPLVFRSSQRPKTANTCYTKSILSASLIFHDSAEGRKVRVAHFRFPCGFPPVSFDILSHSPSCLGAECGVLARESVLRIRSSACASEFTTCGKDFAIRLNNGGAVMHKH